MGFDIYGKTTTNKKGKYFRNNVWRWRPLAEFVLMHIMIPEAERQYWGSNVGQKVSAETALYIANELDKMLASGKVARYEEEYTAKLETLPDNECSLCESTGRRRIDTEVSIVCNGCDGKGTIRPWETNYPFSEANVKVFAEFCRVSEGFEIH